MQECGKRKVKSILFTGFDGMPEKECADFTITANGEATATIQELHIILAHSPCGYIENKIF